MRLDNKVAIITGAGRGMGRAGAERFAAEGASVVVADYRFDEARQTVDAIVSGGGRATAIACDVTNAAQVTAMVEATRDTYGRIDILWNNVGGVGWRPDGKVAPVSGSILATDEADWDWMLELNLKSVYLCCRAVLPAMISQHSGSIILSSSAPALSGNTSSTHAYVVAKGGVVTLGKLIASTWGRDGVRCNVILPGLTDSHTNPGLDEWAAQVTALGRIGRVDEVASAAVFLASDDASFVSGETILVDGGAAVWRGGGPPRARPTV